MTFRPETYALVKAHGVIGVRAGHKPRFAELAPGDKFLGYVTRQQRLDGHGEIVGAPYIDETPLFGTHEPYALRCKVHFAESRLAANIGDALWHLDAFASEMKTTPSNAIFCKGGFMRISARDYDWLLRVAHGHEKAPSLEWKTNAR